MDAIRVAVPLFLLLDIACAVASKPSATPCPAPPSDPLAASAVAATPVALPTEADVIRWSHDAIDAWDRGDAATLGAALSEGYWNWEEGAPDGREEVLASVTKRKSPAFSKRVWSNEHAEVRAPYLIFVGEAKEHQAGKLAALFKDGFDILRDEVVETTPDWKKDHAKVEHFVARKR